MIEVLRNKNLTTKFQILVEIADRGPDIQQREIAHKLKITPQAVSDYIAQLINDKLLISNGRSVYRVTNEGVDWIIKTLRDLVSYSSFVQQAVNNISICAAIAEEDLQKDQKVGLKMRDGLLCVSSDTNSGATGTTISDADKGDDVGISNIAGIVPLELGSVVILKIPNIEKGGSKKVNYTILEKHLQEDSLKLAIGIEAFVAMRKTGVEFYQYGVTEAAVEASRSGLNSVVVCTENDTPAMIARLEKEKITYKIINSTR
jgi:putative transcriptional regulator